MRFHVLGLSHTRTTAAYSACAFTQKVRNLCRMLSDHGHTVYHYGVEGSDPKATECVDIVDSDTFRRVHEVYDWRADGFRIDRENDCYQAFVRNAIPAIRNRAQPGDILCCTFGLDHKAVADALPELIAVESGIGYSHSFARFRVYESYAWLNYHLGRESRELAPDWYDCVIPNAYDLAEFPYRQHKESYHIFLGRPTPLKGRQIAIEVCTELGIPLYVAGQGDQAVPAGVTHLGVLNSAERARWVGGAAALWAPTQYVEPFGGVAVEAQLLGTPVITSDFGAFAETVQHGWTGWRCRTYEHFLWAAANVHRLRPQACRAWAESQYSLARVATMYSEYFDMLSRLHTPDGWYSRKPERAELRWLGAHP